MREFVFTIEYERGADQLMDLFTENPNLQAETMAIHVTQRSIWRLERVTGPTTALEAFDDHIENTTVCSDIIGMCDAPVVESDHEVLSRTPNRRIVYSVRTEGNGVHSIPFVAAKHIGDGLLMQSKRRANKYQWSLLVDDDDTVRDIYEELTNGLRDGLSLSIQRLSEPRCWIKSNFRTDSLPAEQKAALEAAVAYGYYETPRRNSLKEIASAMDIPNSTLQYRLNRAEAWLVKQFISNTLTTDTEKRTKQVEFKV
ncbi:helix-turn-helix domain-containing protein [Natrinema limicola]|uniref:Transcriptional regulator n=1 Tax=Natrinema limicola JCM 13563 TaxID=1230457 RepID=M0CGG7_9EURY|nr:helix-turn-helix domain-containing protein [Natrinema limicola]ELZ21452.1 transcriptional regulator [Natrinema limicola JCM 13563]